MTMDLSYRKFYIIVLTIFFSSYNASAQKTVLIEKFTNTSCGHCPDASLVLEDIVDKYDNVIWVSHYKDNGWFDNPLTNDQTAQLWDDVFVPGNPLGMIDRIPVDNYLFIRSIDWENRITEQLDEATAAVVDVTEVEYDEASRELSFDINAVFRADVAAGDYRITAMIVEDNVIGSSQNSYYNEVAGHPLEGRGDIIWDYVHSNVVRAILDDTWGTKDVIPTDPQIGVDYSHNYTYIVPDDYRPAHIRIVCMINKYSEGDILSREVLNANQVVLPDVLWQLTSVEESIDRADNVSLYPNPASDMLHIDSALSSFEYVIMDTKGSVVDTGRSGDGKVIDITHLDNGIYLLSLNQNSESEAIKFSVMR